MGIDSSTTRVALQRVATHVLARARFLEAGRFGLRVLPGGFGTPMFGADEVILRVSGTALVREWRSEDGSRSEAMALQGATLRDVGAFAHVDLDVPFSAGHDTAPLGDLEEPMSFDEEVAESLAEWLRVGVQAIDLSVAALGSVSAPSVLQVWPEHFDAAIDVATASGRCNVGVSVGDSFCAEPYVYVGPWGDERPGGDAVWNAPFGAFRPASSLVGDGRAVGSVCQFLDSTLALLRVTP